MVDIFGGTGEVDAYADDFFIFEPVCLVVFFAFYLVEGSLWAFIEFEFKDKDMVIGFDEAVDASVAGADFAVDADAHVGEKQVDGGVEEFFRVFFVKEVGEAFKNCLEDLEDVLDVVCVEGFFELNGHADACSFGDATEGFDQVGEHGVFNFEVWVVEEVLAVFVA